MRGGGFMPPLPDPQYARGRSLERLIKYEKELDVESLSERWGRRLWISISDE